MPPHSKSDMRCESPKCDQNILEISDKLQKINLQQPKTEEEQSTYNIEDVNDDDKNENDESSTSDTEDSSNYTTIKEKGPSKPEKFNSNNRLHPFSRNSTSGGHLIYNENGNNLFNNIYEQNPEFPVNHNLTNDGNAEHPVFSFNDCRINDINPFLLEIDDSFHHNEGVFNENEIYNNAGNYSFNNQPLIINDNSSSNELQLLTNDQNIPAVVIEQNNFPQTSTNRAEQALSNDIDKNKKLKQDIWIMVNIQIENDLIATLMNKIQSTRFTQTELNYIYAIIIRLMKNDCDVDGKRLLMDYFQGDVDVLFKIACKGNVLLMDFILEVMQNLGMNLKQSNILHRIVSYSHVDLSEILDYLLDKTFDNKPSLNMFDVNCVDSAEQTILMVVLRNISMERGFHDVNMKYLDLILRRTPDVTYVTRDGRNVFHDVMSCAFNEDIIQYFFNYYDKTLVDSMIQIYFNGFGMFPL